MNTPDDTSSSASPVSVVVRPARDADLPVCEEILRSLPDWFGIEEAILQYVGDIGSMETHIAEIAGELAGFLTLKRHNPHTAEIQVMAVRQKHHGRGVGRTLVRWAEAELRRQSFEFLEVKTLGPSRPSHHYERTRAFYLAMGFRPLEENRLWGEANPCLILVKHLVCG